MFTRFLIALLTLLTVAACGRPEFGAASEGGKVVDTNVDRASADDEVIPGDGVGGEPDVDEANTTNNAPTPQDPPILSGGKASTADFAFQAYRTVAAQGRNAVIAPHGLARSLVIAYAAAGPEEAAAVADVVGPYLGGNVYQGFNTSDLELDSRQSDGTFQMLAGVWVQDDAAVESEFADLLAMYLGLQLRLIDMQSAPEDARNTINNWYSAQTAGRISEVLGARTLGAQSRFVVTDATWFSAPWGFGGFDPARTTYGTFAGSESNVQLPLMSTDTTLLYVGAPDFDAVVLPFANGFSLLAILPDDLETFEASLDPDFLTRLIDEAQPTEVSLTFPKIEVSDRVALSSVADAIGVSALFADNAEFNGFADGTRLDDAHQRTRIAFDETGASASQNGDPMPGTPTTMEPPIALSFDRPFFFAVRDSASGRFLFLGRVAQP